MFRANKRFSIIFILLALGASLPNAAFAQYEVIKAKTIDNINETKTNNSQQIDIPTYNDPDLPNFSQENSLGALIENKTKNYIEKKRRNKKIKKQQIDEEEGITPQGTIAQDEIIPQTQAYKHPIQEEDSDREIYEKNKFQINADKIKYDDNDGNIYADGNVEIIAKAQKITLKSNKAILDKTTQTLRLFDNVRVLRGGIEMKGDYLLVDLNEQNILMDNPTIDAYSFTIKAQESYLIANDLQLLNGTLKSNRQQEIILESNGFQRYENTSIDYIKNRSLTRQTDGHARKQTYKINSKEVVLTSYKDHNSIVLKGSNVYYNRHKIIHNSDIEILSDKQTQNIETNSPEAGTLRNFGTYVGYGLAYRLPKGATLKLLPALTYGDSNIGVGLIGRLKTNNSKLEAGYNSSTTNLVVKGKYRISNGLSLSYGRNAYMPEGFLGTRRSGYAAQLALQKSFYNEDLDTRFNHGLYAGIFTEYQKHDQENAYATTRFRYMAEARKTFFKYKNKEQDLSFSLGAIAQGAATVYGSGQTTALGRVGPVITTKLKSWESSLAYLLAGVHGDSPFYFDKYMYGKSSIMLNEKFHLSDKFALGFRATVTPMKDNYNGDLLTESRLYAIFGPQDLKLVLSYDFVRDIAHLDMMFIIGTNSSKINFEKLTTKNLDGGEEKRDFYKNAKPVKITPYKDPKLKETI